MLVRQVWPSRPALTNPLADLDKRRREMLRLLDSMAGEPFEEATAGAFPPVNVTQDENHFYVRAEVPGVLAKDLAIFALRNSVSISGRRDIPPEHDRVSYHRKERADGAFERTITLPTKIDTERVDARYADGILTLRLAKASESKPRQIAVKS